MSILLITDNLELKGELEFSLLKQGHDQFYTIYISEDYKKWFQKIKFCKIICAFKNTEADHIKTMIEEINSPEKFFIVSNSPVKFNVKNQCSLNDDYISLIYHFIDSIYKRKKQDSLKDDILIKINDKYKRISIHQIEFIQSDSKYVTLHVGQRKFSLRSTLKNIELILPNHFLRIHSSYIVNLKHIQTIQVQEQNVELTNGSVPFSRKYKSVLFDRFHLG